MAAEEPGQDPIDSLSSREARRDGRLDGLDARLQAAAAAEQARTGTATRRSPEKGYRQGTRVLTELVAGPAGGALLGWLIDRWLLRSGHWALLVGMVLGIVVAFRNIYRISSERPE